MTPITELIAAAMGNIKEMADVNTVVGDAVETSDGTVIIPISCVAVGFGAGGAEFSNSVKQTGDKSNFGGGTGGGLSIQPVGFLIVSGGSVQLLPIEKGGGPDKLVDYIPVAIDKLTTYVKNKKAQDDED